jgi:hypothetical protein
MDATAPGERSVWVQYSDTDFVYVTEDNEVKMRAQDLEDLKPLPSGSTGVAAHRLRLAPGRRPGLCDARSVLVATGARGTQRDDPSEQEDMRAQLADHIVQ